MKNRRTRRRELTAARQVERLFNKSAAPDWLTNAMMVALNEASKIQGVTIWQTLEDETEDFDVGGLADLFASSQHLSLQGEVAANA